MISTQDYSKEKLKLESSNWRLNILGVDPNKPEDWIIDQQKIKQIQYKYFNESPGWSLIGIKVCNKARLKLQYLGCKR